MYVPSHFQRRPDLDPEAAMARMCSREKPQDCFRPIATDIWMGFLFSLGGYFRPPKRKVLFPAAEGRSAAQLQYLKHLGRMVKNGVVNAAARNFFLPHFCVFFRDSGQFLDSRNPVNYLFVTPSSLAKL